ncbi:ferritin-like domain-containing protein [Heliophilum fasciatum]|uniref:Rubrerythrin n=1 Tax=Heliophilum fasciatum TaxID=35700 RepID=A0A4V2SX55_9FIRM|nr:ferritin family protein [Heliophilum fasciatum]MCW2277607.1 rubrerythrin [Heliophilum fasciatum]TCP64956.1 rubrerythrin [Heliophilum fasciatum]
MHSKELTILKRAITHEHENAQFYRMAAEQVAEEEVKSVFLYMATEEDSHADWLVKIHHDLAHGKPVTSKDLPVHRDDPGTLTHDALTDAATTVVSALHVGVMLEKSAVDYYRGAAKETGEATLKELYNRLANWEAEHLGQLEKAYDFAKEEWWDRQGFSPS